MHWILARSSGYRSAGRSERGSARCEKPSLKDWLGAWDNLSQVGWRQKRGTGGCRTRGQFLRELGPESSHGHPVGEMVQGGRARTVSRVGKGGAVGAQEAQVAGGKGIRFVWAFEGMLWPSIWHFLLSSPGLCMCVGLGLQQGCQDYL